MYKLCWVAQVWYNRGFTVKQCLLWVTCTGRHWLIALWVMIGATYWSVTTSGWGHCTVTWVLHPGGEARNYWYSVQYNTAQLREPGSCIPPLPIFSCYAASIGFPIHCLFQYIISHTVQYSKTFKHTYISWWVTAPDPAWTSSKWFFLCSGDPVWSVGILVSSVQLLMDDP